MAKVLNGELYKALASAFGRPSIYSKGEPARYQADTGTSLDEAGVCFGTHVKGGERYVVPCPFCGRKKLWLSYLAGAVMENKGVRVRFSRGLVICYRCLFNKDLTKFQQFWDKLKENGYEGNGVPLEASANVYEGDGAAVIDAVQSAAAVLPGCVPLTGDDTPAAVHEYLRGRGIDPYDLERELSACWSDDPEKKGYGVGRIIFPVWQNHRLVGYQGRALDKDVSDRVPKYWFPHGSQSNNWLYNLDRARWCDPVVLVEGVLDVYKVGAAGVGRFGKVTHPRQLALLRAIWGTRSLVYLPDTNDPLAIAKAREEAMDWQIRGLFAGGVDLVYLPRNRDPGGMSRKELYDIIKQRTGKEIPV